MARGHDDLDRNGDHLDVFLFIPSRPSQPLREFELCGIPPRTQSEECQDGRVFPRPLHRRAVSRRRVEPNPVLGAGTKRGHHVFRSVDDCRREDQIPRAGRFRFSARSRQRPRAARLRRCPAKDGEQPVHGLHHEPAPTGHHSRRHVFFIPPADQTRGKRRV